MKPMYAYDYNIWGSDKGEIRLSAYEWQETDGYIETNYDRFHTLQLNAPEDIKEIEYLLDDLYINHYPLTDYDTWQGLEFLTRGTTPAKIQEFLDSLPDYTIPNYNKEEANA